MHRDRYTEQQQEHMKEKKQQKQGPTDAANEGMDKIDAQWMQQMK